MNLKSDYWYFSFCRNISIILVNGNGECLHVESDSNNPNDYTNVNVEGCNSNSVSQQWAFSTKGQLIHTASGDIHSLDLL